MNEQDRKVLFSQEDEKYITPQPLFDKLDEEFNFNLDPAASDKSAKCGLYYTPDHDGLNTPWGERRVFINPPYSIDGVSVWPDWVEKGWEEAKEGALCVFLLASRTDTKAWHNYIMDASEIRFIKGRLKFSDMEHSAPFPSVVVIYRPYFNPNTTPIFTTMKRK